MSPSVQHHVKVPKKCCSEIQLHALRLKPCVTLPASEGKIEKDDRLRWDEEEQLDNGEGKIIMDQGTLLDEVADAGQSQRLQCDGGIVEQALDPLPCFCPLHYIDQE